MRLTGSKPFLVSVKFYGNTVKVAVLLTLFLVAVIVTFQVMNKLRVVMVKLALVAPAGTVTEAGTVVTVVLLVLSVTCAPPVGAGLVN
jgi:hypothetical protein